MKGGGLIVLAMLALAAGAPTVRAAQEASPAAAPYAAEDASGQALSFDEPVERIVCLQTGCDEILADLSMLPVATVVTQVNAASPLYYGDAADQVPTLTDAESVEEVAGYEPDLIYVRDGMEETASAMAAVAPVFVGHGGFDATPAVYEENLRDLAALTGRPAQAEAAIARFRGVVESIAAGAPAEGAPRFLIVSGFDPTTYFVFARGSIFCNLLEANSLGSCVVEPPTPGEPFGEVDAEEILAADPDLVGYIARDGEPGPEERTDPVWPQLTAVREGRVYTDASDGLYCCGLRHVQYSLELYAHHAFPEAGFPEPAPYLDYDPARPANPPAPR